jgi:hypothetical protein
MKKFSMFFIVVLIISLILVACSSDSATEAPQEAEEVVEPTAVPTEVSNLPEEEEVTEEEPKEAPDVDTSRGLFDSAAMVETLEVYVLRPENLPDPYKIAEDGEQHMTNLKVINAVGEVDGKRYIAATERVDGWTLELQRVNREDLIPYTMYSSVEVFETKEGAEAAFGPDWLPVYAENEDEEADKAAKWIEDGCDLADGCIMYFYEKLDPATDVTTLEYVIVFVDRNVVATVMGRGADYDMNPEYIQEAADFLFDKIESAPMAE